MTSDLPDDTAQVSRSRHITGLVAMALGALLAVGVGWLAVFSWASFGPDERVRFTFLLGLGIVLVLAGCWLTYRSRVAGWIAVLVILTGIVAIFIRDYIL